MPTKSTPPVSIDCDAVPFIPYGWRILEEDQLLVPGRVRGPFFWDPDAVRLYASQKRQDGETINGTVLCEELESQPVFPANLLDYLYDHPQLVPEEWRFKLVFFWGTIYRSPDDTQCIRYLLWVRDICVWGRWDLSSQFCGNYMALVRA